MADIDLFASLRDVSAKGRVGQKFGLSIKAPKLIFHPDDKQVAGTVALAIAEQLKENLLSGKRPDGAPMPGIDPDTAERRQDLEEQGKRGGEADSRYRDDAFRARVKKHYDRQFSMRRGPNAGKAMPPKAGGPRGVVSGLLAHSFLVRPDKDGKGFMVYVAAARKAALPRVFAGIPLWTQGAMLQPKLREAMKQAAARILPTSVKNLLAESAQFLRSLQSLAAEAEELGEGE